MSWRKQKKRKTSEVIQKKIPGISVSLLSHVLGLSWRVLYKKDHTNEKQRQEELIKEQILSVLSENPSYGHRRIALALHQGKKKIRKIMKTYGIKPYKRQGRWRKRRDERRDPQPYPNLIKGSCPIVPGLVLVGDFTYLPYQGRFLYLATYMDLYTREIVGWHISTKHTKEIVLEALLDAIHTLKGVPTIVHTDQGSEYCAKEYLQFLQDMNINISMSKKASPWENGYQESFYNNFKTDLGLEFDRYPTMGKLIEGIHQTIHCYNTQISLKMAPKQFSQRKLKY